MITVGIPAYRCRDILWLALDSLAAQADAPPWELVVYEDAAEPAGEGLVRQYEEAMSSAGCTGIAYGYNKERQPLSAKWRQIGHMAGSASELTCLQGADDYSAPDRLRVTWNAWCRHERTPDWLHYSRGYFWDCAGGQMSIYDRTGPGKTTGVGMALPTTVMRCLPAGDVWRGCDGWLQAHALAVSGRSELKICELPGWAGHLYTDGFNTCSAGRFQQGALGMHGFTPESGLGPSTIIPAVAAHRLRELRPMARRNRLRVLRERMAKAMRKERAYREQAAAINVTMHELMGEWI